MEYLALIYNVSSDMASHLKKKGYHLNVYFLPYSTSSTFIRFDLLLTLDSNSNNDQVNTLSISLLSL
jgi:hypothetical protein